MFRRVGDENDIIQCPYNVSHQILRQRFQVHLVRCRRSHPHVDVVICPFNITHRVNKPELQWHVSVCPERQSFENFKYREGPIEGLTSSIDTSFGGDMMTTNTTFLDCPVIESSENWDDEPDVPSYDPSKYLETALVIRIPIGMPPSQRSAFREAERKRWQSLTKY